MKRLKANGLSLGVLDCFYEPVEIYDATGTTLIGTFTPADPEGVKRIYESYIASRDLEELARLAAEPGPGRLLSDIIKELKIRYPIDAPPEPPPTGPTVQPGSNECVSP
jgi:hypothetical protein